MSSGARANPRWSNLADEDVASRKAHAADKRGLKVAGHLCSIALREAAELGIDNVERRFGIDTGFNPEKRPDVWLPTAEQSRAGLSPEEAQTGDVFRTLIGHHAAVTSTL